MSNNICKKKSRIIDSQRQPSPPDTVFENYRKSLIGHCEQSELHLHFECTKVHQKSQKSPILESFWKPESCRQPVVPDKLILKGQKLMDNAKIGKFKQDILSG